MSGAFPTLLTLEQVQAQLQDGRWRVVTHAVAATLRSESKYEVHTKAGHQKKWAPAGERIVHASRTKYRARLRPAHLRRPFLKVDSLPPAPALNWAPSTNQSGATEMSSMSYCQWQNTEQELKACAEDLEARVRCLGPRPQVEGGAPDPLSSEERAAMGRVFTLMINMLEELGVDPQMCSVEEALEDVK